MNASLKDILNVVGPSASLVFAAWIFLSVLQTRYVAAFERYRALVQEYRGEGGSEARRGSVRLQIGLYKRRCELMRLATNLGIVAAVLLILSLLAGGLEQLLPDAKWIGQVGMLTTLAGLAMVIVAAIPVAVENVNIQRSLDEEARDLPELSGDVSVRSR